VKVNGLTNLKYSPPKTIYRNFGMLNNALRKHLLDRKKLNKFTGKELDAETGLYYYGARYLDPKTSRWLSGDPAMGEYLPVAPVNDEAKKRNGNLPGQGGVFNYVNLHAYHYAGNNPVKYVDPDGRISAADATNILDTSMEIAREFAEADGPMPYGDAIGVVIVIGGVIAFLGITIYLAIKEHTSDARPSTKEKHEEGRSRQEADREGRKGYREPPRKRPEGHQGPWPPRGSSITPDQYPERAQDNLSTPIDPVENRIE